MSDLSWERARRAVRADKYLAARKFKPWSTSILIKAGLHRRLTDRVEEFMSPGVSDDEDDPVEHAIVGSAGGLVDGALDTFED